METTTLPDGRKVERDVVIHPGAVAILPLIDAEHICLLRNVRPVVGDTLWEIPAGTLEAVKRDLLMRATPSRQRETG